MMADRSLTKDRANAPPPATGMHTLRYTLFGVLFGLAFPIVATSILLLTSRLPFSFASIAALQSTESLLWIIDTAPLFLGFFAALAGGRQDRLQEINRKLIARESELKQNQSDLELRVKKHTDELERKSNQLNASAHIIQQIAELHDLPTLITTVTILLAEQGNFHHVGFYLSEENRKIFFLQAASSETGTKLISRGYHAGSDLQNILNQAISENRILFSLDTSRSREFRDENFPGTRSRAIIPISLRGEVTGALDLQSTTPSALNQDEIDNLASVARFIAVSIENIRLLSRSNELVQQLTSAASAETQGTWLKVAERRTPAYQYTPAGVRPYSPLEGHPPAQGSLKIPVILRDQQIGSITLRRGSDSPDWSERERILLEKISAQVALALDNSRLIDDVQRSAQRDQILATVSSRIRETLDLEAVLQRGAREFVRSLNLKEAEVRLGGSAMDTPASGSTSGRRSGREYTQPLA